MIYRITRLHAASRGGINQAVDAEVRGIAKTNDQAEYTIANELVAAKIGQALGLPIPAGVVAEDSSGKFHYFSLDVSKTGHTLPPTHPPDLFPNHAHAAAGCVVFDFFIANEDRHAGNLSLDLAFAPPRLSLFDHGHSLLGPTSGKGAERLDKLDASPGCLGPPDNAGHRQAVLDHLESAADIDSWLDRIEQLPDYVIEDACDLVADPDLNVPEPLRLKLASWLKARKRALRSIVENHKMEFKAVTAWTLP